MTAALRIEASPVGGETLDLVVAGDSCLRTPESRSALRSDAAGLYGEDVRSLFAAADASLVNLECPIGEGGTPIPKAGMNIAGHGEMVDALRALGLTAVSLANNHILDQGADAMFATERACNEAGVVAVGVGRDRAHASRPHFVERKGLRVAFHAFAETEFSCAGRTTPGAAPLDPETAGAAIRETRREADVVVASVHGGSEHYFAPSPRTQSWYRFLVDSGAHAVIGHHPHVVQGSEVYRGGFIAYSLGNFLFDSPIAMRPSWHRGLVLRVTLGAAGVGSVEFHPTRQVQDEAGLRVSFLQGEDLERAGKRLAQLSETAADPDAVEGLWRCYCSERRAVYERRLLANVLSGGTGTRDLLRHAVAARAPHYLLLAGARALGRLAVSERRRRAEQARLVNLFQCPAHREITTTNLQMDFAGEGPSPEWQARYRALSED